MKVTILKADNIGALASSLCLAHCIATPFFFIATSCAASCCAEAPLWWSGLDYIFLIISFFAVLRSTATTSKGYMKPALWISWSIFFIFLLMQKTDFIHIPIYLVHIPAISLAVMHIYNLTFCQCKKDSCCAIR